MYLVFSNDRFYPHGAPNDLVGHFDSPSEALWAVQCCTKDYQHIYDINGKDWVNEATLIAYGATFEDRR